MNQGIGTCHAVRSQSVFHLKCDESSLQCSVEIVVIAILSWRVQHLSQPSHCFAPVADGQRFGLARRRFPEQSGSAPPKWQDVSELESEPSIAETQLDLVVTNAR